MNTIPTTFNNKITNYTAVGGKERTASNGISAVILNRTGFPRRSFFQEIEKTGFDNVISIESASVHFDIEEMAERFPFVRFILPENQINLGEQINLAASEIESPLFFVLRNDMKLVAGGNARRMAERLSVNSEEDANTEKNTGFKRLCTVPLIMNSNYGALPTLVMPMTHNRKMKTVFSEPQQEGELSIFPYDGIGIYDRRRFIQIGGYDTTINNPHWQLMDFGFRAYLWGEEISLNLHYKISCDGELPPQDFTVEENYRRFYLKNLAPVYKRDYAHLPFYRFPAFFRKSGEDIFLAWDEFLQTRKWVIKNKYRWKCDAHSVTCLWDNALKQGE